jgi:hypothetical protein
MNLGHRWYSFFGLFSLNFLSPTYSTSQTESLHVTPVTSEVRNHLKLSEFYQKRVSVGGLSVLGSKKVSDYALKEAAYLIKKMTHKHPEYLEKLAENKVRFSVMARDEFTTDIPEHSDLAPPVFWDKRARGLGATRTRPSVSCGEENLLEITGDPYKHENILIHEFAHALHAMAINDLDPSFQEKLKRCYSMAIRDGIWKGTYAATNPAEYWAEGVQSWFECNREGDREHGQINTREEISKNDPRLAKLIQSKLGLFPWKYVPISKRLSQNTHLSGYNPKEEIPFAWPKDLLAWHKKFENGEVSLAPSSAKNITPLTSTESLKSNFSRRRCQFFIHNLSGQTVQIHWIDFKGQYVQPRVLRHKDYTMIHSFVGHCWRIKSYEQQAQAFTTSYRLPDHTSAKLHILNPQK